MLVRYHAFQTKPQISESRSIEEETLARDFPDEWRVLPQEHVIWDLVEFASGRKRACGYSKQEQLLHSKKKLES